MRPRYPVPRVGARTEVTSFDNQEVAHSASTFTSPPLGSAKSVLHDRIRDVPNFTGRRDDSSALERTLWNQKAALITQAAVQGLGGVGKSSLAIQYGWENRERYSGVWWLSADTRVSIIDGLVALGAHFIPRLAEMENCAEAAQRALAHIAEAGADKPFTSFTTTWRNHTHRTGSRRVQEHIS